MSTEPSRRGPTRRALLLVGLLALSLGLAVLAPAASAAGEPNNGFCERDCSERFQVMGDDWTVRTNLLFADTETVRVNVTSLRIDWLANAGGAGAMDLTLRAYDGTTVGSFVFAQVASGPARYTVSIDLSALTLAQDWYYLRIFIDDTQNTFEAVSAVKVGLSSGPHSVETYTDDTFNHASDVFTTASRIWVRVVGDPGQDAAEWDIYEFVNGDSLVNGPVGNFDDFSRTGNVYTFSIDLSQWSGGLPVWWSYSLSVRLTNGALDAGKQIQIYDPGLTFTSANLAPAQARQGQTDVPMLALTISLPPNLADNFGPAAFNLERLRVSRVGAPGTNADVSAVRIWLDANANGSFDATDLLLASRAAAGGLPFPAWVGVNGVGMTAVGSGAPLRLIVTMDVAPAATPGNLVGLRINGIADVDMAGHVPSILGLPVQSGTVAIAAADVLFITNDPAVAPALAAQGQADLAVDRWSFSTNGVSMSVTSLSVELLGPGVPTDVSRVFLRIDDGDGVYEPAADAALGTATTFPASRVATFSGLSLAVGAAARDVWAVFNVSSTATIGDDIGTRLASNASVAATGGGVYGGNFPLDSGLTTVRGPLLTVASTGLAPAQAPVGRFDVPMLRLDLLVDFGRSSVLGLRVDKRGSSPADADVAAVRLYRDADGDGLWTREDEFLASSIFVGGATVFSSLDVAVGPTQATILFLVLDVSGAALVGDTIGVELQDETYFAVDSDTTVDPDPFAIRSGDVLLVGQSLGTISGTVADGSGNPIAGATVALAGTNLTTTTDTRGVYVVQDLPMGTYYLVVQAPGFQAQNVSAILAPTEPSKVVDVTLSPTPGLEGTLVLIGGALALVLLALLGLLFLASRRRNRCPVCGKPKARDRPVCPECEAKGLGPTSPAVPPPPPP